MIKDYEFFILGHTWTGIPCAYSCLVDHDPQEETGEGCLFLRLL